MPRQPVAPSTEPTQLLRSWTELNDYLRSVTEYRELLPLLEYALAHKSRELVVKRVYQRLTRLRAVQERKLLQKAIHRGAEKWEFPIALQ